MMKKTFSFLFQLILLAAVFTGCSKDDDTSTAAANYSPLSVGSNWTYTGTEGTSAPVTYKLTVSSKDTLAMGKTYKVLTNSGGANYYMTSSGSNYYRLNAFPSFGITSFEDLYLMDNKNVNETWTSSASFTYSGFPLTASLLYTIKEKGITYTVNSKSYTDVIHVRLDLSIAGFGAMGGGEFYYAKGVGMISNTIAITPPVLLGVPNYNYNTVLTSYEIK